MWIFTDCGFFSVVAHQKLSGMLFVRARVREDLAALAARFPAGAPKITHTPQADYPYKMIVPKQAFADVLAAAILGITYPNFKTHIVHAIGHHRASVYYDVWDLLRRDLEPK